MSSKAQRDIPGIPIKQALESQKKSIENYRKNNAKRNISKNMRTRSKKEGAVYLSKTKTA